MSPRAEIMNKWMTEAAGLLQQRAPMLTDVHASDISRDLHRAWPTDAPAVAVAKFCREVPVDWKTKPKKEVAAH